ncbi:MAG TPA: hypothetical protein VFM18_18095 [Methanosarcina sp.]|nr:hypothetical protein [Methanosarcina sp.]
MALKDIIGRSFGVGDYVVYYSNVYQVLGIGKPNQEGYGNAKICLVDKSKTTKPTTKFSKDMCLVPAEDITIWKLTQ